MQHKAIVLFRHPLFTVSFVSYLKELNFFFSAVPCLDMSQLGDRVQDTTFDYLFIDFEMPFVDILSVIRNTVETRKNIHVIVLSSIESDKHIQGVRNAGAHGFLSKKSDFHEIRDCLTAIQSGLFYISPKVFDNVLQQHLNEQTALLSDREYEVLYFLSRGKKIQEVAELLNISVYLVRKDIQKMMNKHGASTSLELIKIVTDGGYV